jgi:MFS transporter, SP family, general alpha glucoside:H+ symporter
MHSANRDCTLADGTESILTTEITHDDRLPSLEKHASIRTFFGGDNAAKAASQHEQRMTLRYALAYYRKAFVWAALMACPVILEGYEGALLTVFPEYPAFQDAYGKVTGIPTWWQIGISAAAAFGQLAGLFSAPAMANRYGYRRVYLLALALISTFHTLSIVSLQVPDSAMLSVIVSAQFLIGIPLGMLQSIVMPYLSDITPMRLRGPATTLIDICYLCGQLSGCALLRAFYLLGYNIWSVRGSLLGQYLWLPPLFVIVLLAPESPVLLSRNGKAQRAVSILKRLNEDPEFDVDGALGAIRIVDEHEKENSAGLGFRACFTGTNLRRTEISVIVCITQQLTGAPLMFYGLKLAVSSGMDIGLALCASMTMFSLCIIGAIVSTWLLRRFDRRSLWLTAIVIEMVILCAVGVVGFFERELEASLPYIVFGLLTVFGTVYTSTLSPLCFVILSETPSSRLKTPTNSLSRAAYVCITLSNVMLLPFLFGSPPSGWGFGPRPSLIWTATGSLCLVWAYFRLPEMRDRTPAEIDILFDLRVVAQDWKETDLEPELRIESKPTGRVQGPL